MSKKEKKKGKMHCFHTYDCIEEPNNVHVKIDLFKLWNNPEKNKFYGLS